MNGKEFSFHSSLAEHIEAYIAEKRGAGVKFVAEAGRLREIDRFVTANGYSDSVITKELFNAWNTATILQLLGKNGL